jgi:Large ribosomal RNA subunit accumulation protein YceD
MSRHKREAIPRGMPVERPWRVPLTQSSVTTSGLHVDLTADERVRSRLARVAGLEGLPRLSASFDVTLHGRNGLRVAGRVSATVDQICGITLEPFDNEVNEAIDVVFRPDVAEFSAEKSSTGAEIALEDETEPLVNGMIDLGVLATEFLILGIDPYPCKPGTMFEAPLEGGDVGHPFAGLAALTKRRPEGEG